MPEIRSGLISDIGLLQQIDASCDFIENRSTHFEATFRHRTTLALIEEKAVGYLRPNWLLGKRGYPVIERVCVVPEYRGQGIGKFLVTELGLAMLLEGHNNLYTSVTQSDADAFEFFDHLGFEGCGQIALDDRSETEIFLRKDLRIDPIA